MPISTGFYMPDGRDIGQVFKTGASPNDVGYIMGEGLDVAAFLAPGGSPYVTKMLAKDGRDLGKHFLSADMTSLVLVDSKEHNDHEAWYTFNLLTAQITTTRVTAHGWGGYWVRDRYINANLCNKVYQAITNGAKYTVKYAIGYNDDVSDKGSMQAKTTALPSAANGWCLEYYTLEPAKSEHNFRYTITFEF